MGSLKIALINDTDGRENIGCRITSGSLKMLLTKCAQKRGTNIEILPCPWLFKKRAKLSTYEFIKFMLSKNTLSSSLLRELSVIEYGAASLKLVEESHVVVYQPEGTISNYFTPYKILRHLSLPLYAQTVLKKKIIIANGTLPLFDTDRYNLISAFLQRSSAVFLRDQDSANHYDVGFFPDTAFCWDVTSSGLELPADGLLITTTARAGQKVNLQNAQAALELCKDLKLRPIVLTKQWQDLVQLRPSIYSMGGEFHENVSVSAAESIINGCALHIGGRYHMAILCSLLGVPSLLYGSSTHKNTWLANTIAGIGVFDKLSAGDVHAFLESSEEIKSLMRADVARAISDVNDGVMLLFESLLQACSVADDNAVALGSSAQKQVSKNDEWFEVRAEIRRGFRRDFLKALGAGLTTRT